MTDIELTFDGHVATMTLAAPERRNSLTMDMALEMVRLADAVDDNPEIGALIVRGAGGHFCAGAHRDALSRIGEDPSEPSRYELNGAVYEAFARISRSAVPVIAAVQGAAVGAGVNLLLAADLRVVAADARIIAGFLRIGIHPGGGHFVLAGRAMPREAVAATAIFGEELSGLRAAGIGLAWEAPAAEAVDPRAMELAQRAAQDPELARAAIRSMRAELGPPMASLDVALQAERSIQMWSLRRRAIQSSDES